MLKTGRKDNVFNSNLMSGVDSNRFDLSHDVKLSMKMGRLVPVCCMEALPGDKFNLSYVNMLRFAPLIAPVMHRVRVTTDYFFVPNRIIWSAWEEFITGTGDNVEAPWVELDNVIEKGSLADYLGIPTFDYSVKVGGKVSVLPFAAYLKIYDDWYRDQNQIAEQYKAVVPGDNSAEYYDWVQTNKPLKRAWEHDYFTSALPTSQQGTDVEIPLTFQDNIPVEFRPGNSWSGTSNPIVVDPETGAALAAGTGALNPAAGPTPYGQTLHSGTTPAAIDPNGSLVVDVQSDAATINDLRRAWTLQSFLERTIRGGQRYIEQIFSHFQVKSSDARLQRPEFLGRNVQNITISEVLATAQSNNDAATAQIAVGNMAGHGISVGGNNSITYYAEEHGWIFGIMSVLPDTAYQDGLARHFFRFDRLDYAWPSFAGLGEQAILNREVYNAADTMEELEGTFGYIPRYSEYRYMPSRVAGEMRDTLKFWHMGRIFDSMPGLNADFIEADPTKRIFAVTDENEDELYVHIMNNFTVVRKLPRYGVPAQIG